MEVEESLGDNSPRLIKKLPPESIFRIPHNDTFEIRSKETDKEILQNENEKEDEKEKDKILNGAAALEPISEIDPLMFSVKLHPKSKKSHKGDKSKPTLRKIKNRISGDLFRGSSGIFSKNISTILQENTEICRKLNKLKKQRIVLEEALVVAGVDIPDIQTQEDIRELESLEAHVSWLKSELFAFKHHLKLLEQQWSDKKRERKSNPVPISIYLEELETLKSHLQWQLNFTHANLKLEKEENDLLESLNISSPSIEKVVMDFLKVREAFPTVGYEDMQRAFRPYSMELTNPGLEFKSSISNHFSDMGYASDSSEKSPSRKNWNINFIEHTFLREKRNQKQWKDKVTEKDKDKEKTEKGNSRTDRSKSKRISLDLLMPEFRASKKERERGEKADKGEEEKKLDRKITAAEKMKFNIQAKGERTFTKLNLFEKMKRPKKITPVPPNSPKSQAHLSPIKDAEKFIAHPVELSQELVCCLSAIYKRHGNNKVLDSFLSIQNSQDVFESHKRSHSFSMTELVHEDSSPFLSPLHLGSSFSPSPALSVLSQGEKYNPEFDSISHSSHSPLSFHSRSSPFLQGIEELKNVPEKESNESKPSKLPISSTLPSTSTTSSNHPKNMHRRSLSLGSISPKLKSVLETLETENYISSPWNMSESAMDSNEINEPSLARVDEDMDEELSFTHRSNLPTYEECVSTFLSRGLSLEPEFSIEIDPVNDGGGQNNTSNQNEASGASSNHSSRRINSPSSSFKRIDVSSLSPHRSPSITFQKSPVHVESLSLVPSERLSLGQKMDPGSDNQRNTTFDKNGIRNQEDSNQGDSSQESVRINSCENNQSWIIPKSDSFQSMDEEEQRYISKLTGNGNEVTVDDIFRPYPPSFSQYDSSTPNSPPRMNYYEDGGYLDINEVEHAISQIALNPFVFHGSGGLELEEKANTESKFSNSEPSSTEFQISNGRSPQKRGKRESNEGFGSFSEHIPGINFSADSLLSSIGHKDGGMHEGKDKEATVLDETEEDTDLSNMLHKKEPSFYIDDMIHEEDEEETDEEDENDEEEDDDEFFREEGKDVLSFEECKPLDMIKEDPYNVLGYHPLPEKGEYTNLTEILSLPNMNTFSQSDVTDMNRFRMLESQLLKINPSLLKHNERVAFWINIFNALLMYAYLINGIPSSHKRRMQIMSETQFHIGKYSLNALAIEHNLLRFKSHKSELSKRFPEDVLRVDESILDWALTKPEPLVSFALCDGSFSAPVLRVYSSSQIADELETAKKSYLNAAVSISGTRKILIPKLLDRYSLDFGPNLPSVIEWVGKQLPYIQRVIFFDHFDRFSPESSVIICPYDWSFRYLFLK